MTAVGTHDAMGFTEIELSCGSSCSVSP